MMETRPYFLSENRLKYIPSKQQIADYSLELTSKPDSIVIASKNGDIVFANDIFSEITGYNIDEIVKLNLKNIIEEKLNEYNSLTFWNSLYSGKALKENLHFKNRSGEINGYLTTVSTLKNKKGEITHLVLTSEISNYNTNREKEITSLVRFGYFGNLSCSLLHELKSHFALIKMNFNLLQPSSEQEKNIYSIIERDLDRVNKLFYNFSQLSKNKDIEYIELNIRDVISYSYTAVKPLTNSKKIKFTNNVEPLIIKGDYQKLKCLFKNLIDNSIDAIEKEGEIKVWSKKFPDHLVLYFKDNGGGISNAENIFEPFYSTKSSGTGLGLAIVKKIIEEHRGEIILQKCKKGETVFEIKYPL